MDMLSPTYYRDESVESAVRDSDAVIDYVRSIDPAGAIVKPIVTPRFAPSCTAECLAGLGRLAKEKDAFVQTHVCEDRDEIAFVKELFPGSESYAGVYDAAELLTPKTILAHAVHLSEEERLLIKNRGAKISHCPASNTALTSGAAPVRTLLDEGLTVGLGTDVSGGYSPSILEEARQAVLVSRHVAMSAGDEAKLSTEEALWLATRGGAKVVGLEHDIGGFEVGKLWDAQMIALDEVTADGEMDVEAGMVDLFLWEGWEDRVNKWFYGGDDRNCVAVWVRGRLVHSKRGFLST